MVMRTPAPTLQRRSPKRVGGELLHLIDFKCRCERVWCGSIVRLSRNEAHTRAESATTLWSLLCSHCVGYSTPFSGLFVVALHIWSPFFFLLMGSTRVPKGDSVLARWICPKTCCTHRDFVRSWSLIWNAVYGAPLIFVYVCVWGYYTCPPLTHQK